MPPLCSHPISGSSTYIGPRDTHKEARTEEILGELAELGLALARDLATCARASEDPGEMERLATAFQKTSRAVRLTLALDAKLDRDAARDAREAAREDREAAEQRDRAEAARAAAVPKPPPQPKSNTEARKDRVRDLMNRLLWTESEGDEEEYDVLREDLEARLSEAARSENFEAVPVEVLAQLLKADMGLSGRLALSPIPAPKPPSSIAAANGHDPHPPPAGPGP